ncbi:ribosome-inactivating protein 3-like [Miscanthus floridulus]|uniref:ribosome-inactivating protein 3-like n=1 Tax=Miscanthus floridulus TaxID=154761 RepID=UPI00345810C7
MRIQLIRLLLRFSRTVPYNPTDVMQRYVLGPRRLDFYDEPPEWIYIHVVAGDAPQDKVTLTIAIDDLYLLGFNNGTDHWYQFSAGPSKSYKGLPGATMLPIEENYRDLIGGGHVNLNQVPLGKKSATNATKQLATYDPKITPTSQLQDGLVRFVVMMCEGMRFREIRETFSGSNWDKETFITQTQENSVVIRWELTRNQPRGAKWGAPRGKYKELADKVKTNSEVNGFADAIKILDFLIRPKETIPTY